jgi:hypothetical protein
MAVKDSEMQDDLGIIGVKVPMKSRDKQKQEKLISGEFNPSDYDNADIVIDVGGFSSAVAVVYDSELRILDVVHVDPDDSAAKPTKNNKFTVTADIIKQSCEELSEEPLSFIEFLNEYF